MRDTRFSRRFFLLAAVFAPALIVLFGVGVGSRLRLFQVGELTMDLAAIAQTPVYFGSISTLGFLLSAGTVAVCALAAALLPTGMRKRMFVAFGAFTGMLLIDDWLLLHERCLPNYVGIPEPVVVGTYALTLLILLFVFRRELLQGEWLLLMASLSMSATSVVADLLFDSDIPRQGQQFIEDGAKLMGIVGWFGFFFVEAKRAIDERALKEMSVGVTQRRLADEGP